MLPTLRTRKPVVKLTAGDLREFPIWEYAIDEEGDGKQDETWVRPVSCHFVSKNAYSQIVASDFSTVQGRRLQGFMEVTTANGIVEISPGAVVGRIGYRCLPCLSLKLAIKRKAPWDVELRNRFLAALRLAETQVYPLFFSLRAPIRGEKTVRTGTMK